MDADSFTGVCKNLSWVDVDIAVVSANAEFLDRDERAFLELADELRKADLLILRMHGGSAYFRKYDRLIDLAFLRNLPTMICSGSAEEVESRSTRSMFPFPDEEFRQLHDYIEVGGERNFTATYIWACRKFCGLTLGVPEMEVPPAQGLYRPGSRPGFRESQFLKSIDWTKPTVAVLFSQSSWIRGITRHVDRLVEEIEARGANAIPIFFTPTANETIGSIGLKATIRKYLMKGRKPRVGAVVMCMGFSQTAMSKESNLRGSIFEELGVPVIQAPIVYRNIHEWEENPKGMDPDDLSMSVVQPEFDGQIHAPPVAFTESRMGRFFIDTVPDRVSAIANSALAWCRLGSLSRREVRIAIVLGAPSTGRIGYARGLDTMRSLEGILNRMSHEGYSISDIMGACRGIAELLERGSDDGYEGGCVDRISAGRYHIWYDELTPSVRFAMGSVAVGPGSDQIQIHGVLDGNVFIGVQPRSRVGDGGPPMTHEFLAFYRWIEDVFGADAIVTIGTGYDLDGLEGKDCALSSECLPDIVLGSMVHVHLNAIDDPAGALRSKRRTHAVSIGYMVPAVTRAGIYGEMAELKSMVQEELMVGESSDDGRLIRIRSLMDSLSIWQEVGMSDSEPKMLSTEGLLRISSYLNELEDASIDDGLHVFGVPPEGDCLADTAYEMVRSPNGEVPSIIQVASGRDPRQIIDRLSSLRFDGKAFEAEFADEESVGIREVAGLVCESIVPSLMDCGTELDSLMYALEGRFIQPGPGGSPYMGNVHLLPSGRNIYGPNPLRIPDEVGWQRGAEIAETIVRRYVAENGRYPNKVVMVMHASDIVSTGGSEVACVLRLMGLKPNWGTRGGSIIGTTVIPLSELGRPRVQVRIGCSSLFSGTFPDSMALIEDGIQKTALLEEVEESNAFRRGLEESITDEICDSMSGGADLVILNASESIRGVMGEGLLSDVACRPEEGAQIYMMSQRPDGTFGLRSSDEELAFTMRSKVLNPRWIQGLMRHGHSGAAIIPTVTSRLASWWSKAGSTRAWMYHGMLDAYIMDDTVRKWMMDSNPHALSEVLIDLLDAAEAGMWKPTGPESETMKQAYLETESVLEDSYGRDGDQPRTRFHRYEHPNGGPVDTHPGATCEEADAQGNQSDKAYRVCAATLSGFLREKVGGNHGN